MLGVACASPLVPRSTDTELRRSKLDLGVNRGAPLVLDNDPVKAVERSCELADKGFNPYHPPEFVSEIDQEEWLRLTSDLPAKGEAGTARQQLNCRRILQILGYDETRRRMAGVK